MSAVQILLRAASIGPQDLADIVITRGPGSFTGVRVIMATALGLSHGSGVPIRAYSSLLAQATRTEEAMCVAIQPARRNVYFAQPFKRGANGPEPIAGPRIETSAELTDEALPIVAPAGVELPAEVVLASVSFGTSQALLHLLHLDRPSEPMAPLYVEPPSARPPHEDH